MMEKSRSRIHTLFQHDAFTVAGSVHRCSVYPMALDQASAAMIVIKNQTKGASNSVLLEPIAAQIGVIPEDTWSFFLPEENAVPPKMNNEVMTVSGKFGPFDIELPMDQNRVNDIRQRVESSTMKLDIIHVSTSLELPKEQKFEFDNIIFKFVRIEKVPSAYYFV